MKHSICEKTTRHPLTHFTLYYITNNLDFLELKVLVYDKMNQRQKVKVVLEG